MVNIAVIGIGEWGKNHVRVVKEIKDFNLSCICDVNDKNLEKMKEIHKIKTITDYREILENDDIKAVTICTPSDTHYKIAKQALEAQKHVLVEKPITLNSNEAKELIEIAKENQLVLMVGHIFRYNNALNYLREKIKSKELGKIYYLTSNRFGLRVPRKDSGVIFNYAVHDIDILDFLLEKQYPLEVSVMGSNFFNEGLEDVAFISLLYDDGVVGQISVSWLPPKKTRDVSVIAEKKSIYINTLTQEVSIFDTGIVPKYSDLGTFSWITKEGDELRPRIENQEPLKEELRDFYRAITKKVKPKADAEVGLTVVQTAEACLLSIKNKKTVVIQEL
ncbi:MAG: Gfo/Idh/MocA family oxidoreductase [Candidatus Helarchaeota archaeon]|nr:Gfo/Idh/MocA family oxidoreductase [Candidatus Helarchaeota archaeon]